MQRNELIETLRVPAKKGSKYEKIRLKEEKEQAKRTNTKYIKSLSDVPLRIFLLFLGVSILYLGFSSVTFWEWVLNHFGVLTKKNHIHEEEL